MRNRNHPIWRVVSLALLFQFFAAPVYATPEECVKTLQTADPNVERRHVPLVAWTDFTITSKYANKSVQNYPQLNLNINSNVYTVHIPRSSLNPAHDIDLIIPAWDDATVRQKIEMARMCIGQLPLKNIDVIRTVRVNDRDNETINAFWRSKYPNFTKAAALGGGGAVDIFPAGYANFNEFTQGPGLMRHEYAHNVASRFFGTTDPAQTYIDAARLDPVTVSTYGNNSWAEDFAEAHRVYIASDAGKLDPNLRTQLSNRFQYLDKYYDALPEKRGFARTELFEQVAIAGKATEFNYVKTAVKTTVTDGAGNSKKKVAYITAAVIVGGGTIIYYVLHDQDP